MRVARSNGVGALGSIFFKLELRADHVARETEAVVAFWLAQQFAQNNANTDFCRRLVEPRKVGRCMWS